MKLQIISSKGYWQNGWLPNTSTLQHFMQIIRENGIEVSASEVQSASELEVLLTQIDPDSLILPNAYHVSLKKGSTDIVWMGDILDKYNCKIIGSGTKSLQKVLQKHICQQVLKACGVPVPAFAYIEPKDAGNEKTILRDAEFTYPAIIKLTGESSGVGISEESVVESEVAAIAELQKMLAEYQQALIIETFLPGKDITAARFRIGEASIHLATHYQIENKPVLGYAERQIPWGKTKTMKPVKETFILEQIDEILPKVWEIFEIRDLVRVDGKLDAEGRFRIFDVNGFPGLVPNRNTFPVQCNTCFPNLPNEEVYKAMLNTLILSAAHRYGMTVPSIVEEHNFFSLEKLEIKAEVLSQEF